MGPPKLKRQFAIHSILEFTELTITIIDLFLQIDINYTHLQKYPQTYIRISFLPEMPKESEAVMAPPLFLCHFDSGAADHAQHRGGRK